MKKFQINRAYHTIDAENNSLGRISCLAARLLRGKHKTCFMPNIDCGDFVTIINASKIKLTGKKLYQKKYFHFSGYPGGLKTKLFKDEIKKNTAGIFRKSILNMLADNKLRNKIIKRLVIKL